MMTVQSMLSKRPAIGFALVLFFHLKLYSSHIHCIMYLWLPYHLRLLPLVLLTTVFLAGNE